MFALVLPENGSEGKLLTFSVPPKFQLIIKPFCRVIVDIRDEKVKALVIEFSDQADNLPSDTIKPILRVLDAEPIFNLEQWQLARQISPFYLQPLNETVFTFLPAGVRDRLTQLESKSDETEQSNLLNFSALPEQKKIIDDIILRLADDEKNKKTSTHLLYGITGAGKTFIYIQLIRHLLQQGFGSLLMLPEIALSFQFLSQLKPLFGEKLAILHSGLGQGERLREYKRILCGEALVVIGTRSAVFAPVQKLRLVILDEEHDPSYKEQKGMRYHARQVASFKLKIAAESYSTSTLMLLGSATPSAESYFHARNGSYQLHLLTKRATAQKLPEVHVVKNNFSLNALVSPFLRDKMKQHLQNGNQIMLLLNRRGHSSYAFCDSCEQILLCPHCSVSLTYHKKSIFEKSALAFEHLKCHICGYTAPFQKSSICRTSDCKIKLVGEGTQKLEDYLENQFPNISFARLDQDTSSEKDFTADVLKAMRDGELKILIGTQMIAKGFDISGVTLVGIINTDIGLSQPDFRANERVFQVLVQASGRAGRHQRGEVVFQTMQPDHFVIGFAKNSDYESFIYNELQLRKKMNYPPFSRMIRLVIRGQDLIRLHLAAQWVKEMIVLNFQQDDLFSSASRKNFPEEVFGPVEAPLYKIKDEYRLHFLFKDKQFNVLHEFSKKLQKIVSGRNLGAEGIFYYFDIDPLDLS